MTPRPLDVIRTLANAVALLGLLIALPVALVVLVGWPLPAGTPSLGSMVTAIDQRNVPGEVIVNGLAIAVWLLWAQVTWAVVWEAVVNGRRLARGRRARPAPWVPGPLNALAAHLVSGMLAASVMVTTATSSALPALPTLAVTAPAPDTIAPGPATTADGDRVAGPTAAEPAGAGPRWLVGEGDSIWSIAEVALGDGGRSAELLELNPDLDTPRALRPGMVLATPVGAAVPTDRLADDPADAELGSGRVGPALPSALVEVRAGDNLWELSERRLEMVEPAPDAAAVAGHVADVVAGNEELIDDPDLIFPGQVFAFPALGTDVAVAAETEEERGIEQEAAPSISAPTRPEPRSAGASPSVEAAAPAPDGGDGDPAAEDLAGADRDPAVEGTDAAPAVEWAVGLGVAGTLLAAGVVDLVVRRRRLRLSRRRPGTVPAAPSPDLGPIERALRARADAETRTWLRTAMASLAARPVWEGEPVAQPRMGRLEGDRLLVEFTTTDPMAAPVPWATLDDGLTWHVDRSAEADALPLWEGPSPTPLLVTVGDRLLVNLEAVGVLRVVGSGPPPTDLVRSLVHELATSPSAAAVDLRSTLPIEGTDSYPIVRQQTIEQLLADLPLWLADIEAELSRRSASNCYASRLGTDADPIGSVVVVTDTDGAAALTELLDFARRRTLPVACVIVDEPDDADGSAAASTTGEDIEIVVGPDEAILRPDELAFVPQLLDRAAAEQLGALAADAADDREEPLVTGVQLSASVSELPRPVEAPAAEFDAESDAGPGAEAERSPVDPDAVCSDISDRADVEETPEEPDHDGSEEGPGELVIGVLGPVTIDGVVESLTSQQLSLVTFLAVNGPSTRETIVDALWDGQVISRSRFLNLLAETRARVGRHHIPEARDGTYRLQAVTTDLERFERAALEAQRASDGAAIERLRGVLEFVTGVPFTTPGRRFWSWVGDQSHLSARVEALVADTAARLARLEQARGNLEGARHACEQGLLASNSDEVLVVTLTEVYVALGKPGLARRLVDRWEDQISRLDCGDPSEEPRKRLAG